MKYCVTLAGRSFQIELRGDAVLVDGRERVATLTHVPHTPLRQLVMDGRSRALLIARDGDGWLVQTSRDRWIVAVEDERTRRLRELTGWRAPRPEGGTVKAPMPGLVLRVEVEEGQFIEPGTGVAVLEAMKMENEIMSPAGGIVKSIRVRPGQAVEKGAVLIDVAERGKPPGSAERNVAAEG